MTTLLALTPPPGTVDFTGGAGTFGNDFRSAVAGTITGVWYYHTSDNEGANAGVQVHRVSDQFLYGSKSFATSGLTDNAFNLITLDTPVTYATPNETICLSIFYPTGMGFVLTGGLNDLTVGDLTVVRNSYRFDNTSPAFGDFPGSSGSNVGFGVGIEFTAGAAGHAKGAEFATFF